MNVHIIMHESFEAPGAFLDWFERNDYTISYTRLYEQEAFPEDSSNIDFLLILGGPQSPATTKEECGHFDAQKEIDFISKTIQNGAYILGVCLGAQLIGEALGASFEHSPYKEIGQFDLILTEEGKNHDFFGQFGKSLPVGHWHGDMPGLTPTSEVLAYSEGCPRQIVKYDENIYGFQCHFEFTPESIGGMISNCSHEIKDAESHPFIQNEAELRKMDFKIINSQLHKFLDWMTK